MATLEEKARTYALGFKNPATSIAVEDTYIMGARESLSSQWKDPKEEVPETGKEVLAIITFCGDIKDYEIMSYDGEYWIDKTGVAWKVFAWMPIPGLPNKNCIQNNKVSDK